MGTRLWDVKLVDLAGIVSFQTTIVEERLSMPSTPTMDALLRLCLAPRSKYTVAIAAGPGNTFTLSSPNTNLRVSGIVNGDSPQGPFYGFVANHGLPWVQIVSYQGRYIMRDGYHRSVGLLRGGTSTVPAAVQETVSEGELGVKPGFFPLEKILGDRPPLVTDFLDDRLTMSIEIPKTIRIVRITAEEFLVPSEQPPPSS